MRALILTLIVFMLSGNNVSARSYRVSPSEAKYMQRLLRRCEDGNGQSCDEYGKKLVQLDRPGDRRLAIRYIRRACVLTYTPACNRPSPSERAALKGKTQHCGPDVMRMLTLASVRIDRGSSQLSQQVIRISKGSVLEKSGLKVGDVITKVNGVRIASAVEVGFALSAGKALLEIHRSGGLVPLAIYCP